MAELRIYRVTITGTQPLLMHHDDIGWADEMDSWRADKDNRKNSRAGDDRTPAHRWVGSLYRNERDEIIIPTENIMRALMEGASMIPVPGGRGAKTFKAQSQSGIMPRDIGWPLMIDGKGASFAPLRRLLTEKNFNVHRETATQMGFALYVKRARIGQTKHIRVRPRFDRWAASGELVVTDEQISSDILAEIFSAAGTYKGLGDWRPSSKIPGTFGMFEATIKAA